MESPSRRQLLKLALTVLAAPAFPASGAATPADGAGPPLAQQAISSAQMTDHPTRFALPVTPARREFMLTFDDGPLPGRTDRIMEVLARFRGPDGAPLRAAFFMVGDAPRTFWQRRQHYAPYEIWRNKGSIRRYPGLVREVLAEKHWIGSHTQHHNWLRWPWLNQPEAIARDLQQWEETVRTVMGEVPARLLRPPYLIVTDALRQAAAAMQYQLILGETVGDANPLLTHEGVQYNALRLLHRWSQPQPCVLTFHENRWVTDRHLGDFLQALIDEGFVPVHFDPAPIAAPLPTIG